MTHNLPKVTLSWSLEPATDEMITSLRAVDQLQPGTAWTLRNAKVDMYRGCMRLAVDNFGKLEPSDNTSIEPKVKI